MGYEIAGGLGVKMADPSREVYVMVGDGSYLMMAQEIVTSIQEGYKLIIVLLDSQGYASIGGLSRAVGSGGFGTQYRYRNAESGALDGAPLPVDLAANAESLGAIVHRATDRASLDAALAAARAAERTTVDLRARSIRSPACRATSRGGTSPSRKCRSRTASAPLGPRGKPSRRRERYFL